MDSVDDASLDTTFSSSETPVASGSDVTLRYGLHVLIMISAGLMIVGSFFAWYTQPNNPRPGSTISGTQLFGGGWLVIILASALVLANFLTMLLPRWSYYVTVPVLGVTTLVQCVFWMFRVKYLRSGIVIDFGWGLWLCFASSLVAAGLALVIFGRYGLDDDDDIVDDDTFAVEADDAELTQDDSNELADDFDDEESASPPLYPVIASAVMVVASVVAIVASFHKWTDVLHAGTSLLHGGVDGLSIYSLFGGWLIIITAGALVILALGSLVESWANVTRAAHVVAMIFLAEVVFFGVRIVTLWSNSALTTNLGWGYWLTLGVVVACVVVAVVHMILNFSASRSYEWDDEDDEDDVDDEGSDEPTSALVDVDALSSTS